MRTLLVPGHNCPKLGPSFFHLQRGFLRKLSVNLAHLHEEVPSYPAGRGSSPSGLQDAGFPELPSVPSASFPSRTTAAPAGEKHSHQPSRCFPAMLGNPTQAHLQLAPGSWGGVGTLASPTAARRWSRRRGSLGAPGWLNLQT